MGAAELTDADGGWGFGPDAADLAATVWSAFRSG
jgi:hypothetical protein